MEIKTFEEMMERFRNISLDENFDLIVAIAYGGIIPATILKQRLDLDMQLLKINLRDNDQKPKYDRPQLLAPINFEFKNKRILLVDDRVKTGASMRFAMELLQGAQMIRTFAVNGSADYSLYNENCFKFFWNL